MESGMVFGKFLLFSFFFQSSPKVRKKWQAAWYVWRLCWKSKAGNESFEVQKMKGSGVA